MTNKFLILLKTLFLSTNLRNKYKFCTDKKKRRKIVANIIGNIVLYLLLIGFCVVICVGYGEYNIINVAPALTAMAISLFSFVFTLLKANGYLWEFKEYDMLLSLPFSAKTVAECKFFYMYIKNLPLCLSVSVATLIGYSIYVHPSFILYPIWVVLSLFIPALPMSVACLIAFLFAKISTRFKKTKIIQTVFYMILSVFLFSLRFVLQNIFQNNRVGQALRGISTITENITKTYPPAKWFSDSIVKSSFLNAFLLILTSLCVFLLVFRVIAKFYKNLNSALRSNSSTKKYKMKKQKTHSIANAIAFKELKRMTGSSIYLVNALFGPVLSLLIGILAMIIGSQKIINLIFNTPSFDSFIIQPLIPFIAFLFIGIMPTTVFTPSLEGKNYWIIKSLPIEKKLLYKGKAVFNLFLFLPVTFISVLCLCISTDTKKLNTVLYLILGLFLCVYSTLRGLACGIKHINLDWENEIEVIKQGPAASFYIIPYILVFTVVSILVGIIGTKINHILFACFEIIIVLSLCLIKYYKVQKLIKKDNT